MGACGRFFFELGPQTLISSRDFQTFFFSPSFCLPSLVPLLFLFERSESPRKDCCFARPFARLSLHARTTRIFRIRQNDLSSVLVAHVETLALCSTVLLKKKQAVREVFSVLLRVCRDRKETSSVQIYRGNYSDWLEEVLFQDLWK